jgi:hypothetical protein
MEFIEKFRLILVKWHVAPLVLLGALVHVMYLLTYKLIDFPCGTDIAVYGIYAGVVGGVLTAMFAAFRLLLTGIAKENDSDKP